MEFANQFSKNHVTCWHQITETVNVSSHPVNEIVNSSDMNEE